MGPEHAKTVADGGFSKADAKRFLQKHAHLPLGRFSKENIERRLRVTFKDRYAEREPGRAGVPGAACRKTSSSR